MHAQQKPDTADNVIRLSDRRVRLHGQGGDDREATATRVDADGMLIVDAGDVDIGRFVWLDVDMPDDEPVRALGEVLWRDPVSLALDIKFKHLFPDQKRRLMRALDKSELGQ
jgi:hypothetical protein